MQCGFCTPAFLMTAKEFLAKILARLKKRSERPFRAISAAAPVIRRLSTLSWRQLRKCVICKRSKYERALCTRCDRAASVQRNLPVPPCVGSEKALKRVEDPTILTGKGIYVDDIALPIWRMPPYYAAHTRMRESNRLIRPAQKLTG